MSVSSAVRLGVHYLRYRFREIRPFEVQASLGNACNLRCSYCRCPDIKTEVLDTEQWCAIVAGLADLGTLRIKFQGGEPTLRTDFGEITAASRRAGIVTAVVTNGIRISEIPSLLDDLDEVVVSFDSLTPQWHDRQRGKGSHGKALAALRLAGGRGLRVVVNMVVHRESLGEVEAMLELCEKEGYSLNAQAVMFGKEYQDATAKGIGLPEEEERALYRRLAAWKRAGRRLVFSADSYDRTAAWPDFGTLTVRGPFPSACPMGREYVHIEPNGDVHPCGLHGAQFTPKNIPADGLEEAVRNASRHDCADCALAYLNERKAVFGLRPAALLEVLRRP
jgi:pyrroloquinoline quinone biosynthesis protein E